VWMCGVIAVYVCVCVAVAEVLCIFHDRTFQTPTATFIKGRGSN